MGLQGRPPPRAMIGAFRVVCSVVVDAIDCRYLDKWPSSSLLIRLKNDVRTRETVQCNSSDKLYAEWL